MKILIISQHLFPMTSPRAHRTTELLVELSKKGHDVTLYAVTGKHDYSIFEKQNKVKIKSIELKFMSHPYNSDMDQKRLFIDKVLGRLFKKIEFPNIEFLYRIPKILKQDHEYDALITIADPHQIHWGTANFKKKYPHLFPKIWIADCGDPFMMNGYSNEHLPYFAKYEKLFCGACDFITVPIENAKQGYYPEFKKKIRVIPQGFNFELPLSKTDVSNSKLTFGFAGNFYDDIRNPELFLQYLSQINMDFEFHVYSPFPNEIVKYKKILGEKLKIFKAINRVDLIESLKNMDFLVNIENKLSPTQIPSKLIDYAIANRPILSIQPDKPNKTVIDEFFKKDYKNQYRELNIEQYHISNVANQFIELIQKY